MAMCYLRLKKYDEAMEHCHSALAIDPKSIKSLYRLGLCCMNRGQFEHAEKYFRKVLSIEPYNRGTLAQLRKMKLESRKSDQKQSAMFSNMFEKTEIYAEKKMTTHRRRDSADDKPEDDTISMKRGIEELIAPKGRHGLFSWMNNSIAEWLKTRKGRSLHLPILLAICLFAILLLVLSANIVKFFFFRR